MSIFAKSQKKTSSRRQIDIKGVQDNILLLPRNAYRAVLHISSINFELKSEAEQDALTETYQSFLNSMSSSLQIIVRIRELDMDKYLEAFKSRVNKEENQVYQDQIMNYTDFVSSLVTTNKILTRQFYVVVPYESAEKDFAVIKEQLALLCDMTAKGLGRMGMQCRQLSSLELLDLFYSFYAPEQAKIQPLSQRTLQLLSEAYL